MAGYPPPYTQPPYGPPFGQDPRQQRRFLRGQARAQAQAQKASMRAQRDLYREQARSLRRNSILGPLLVLGFGIVALLVSLGRISLPRLTGWFSQWWPLLVVGAGLLLVVEWALDQWTTSNGASIGRRRVGGGAVFLLILLISVGVTTRAVRGTEFFNHGFSINSDNWEEVFGEKYDREQQIDQPFAPGTSLSIDNPRGDVTVLGRSGDDKIHIIVTKQVYARSQDEANQKAETISPRLDLSGGTLHMVLPSLDGAVSDLSITLPDNARTIVNANHGDVRISALKAPVDITANRGDVELNQITGQVVTHMNSSQSSFAAHNIAGDVSMKGRADDLSVTDVVGNTSMEGEFYGQTHLERLHGAMTFQTSRTQFSVARVEGEIDMSPDSELTASELVGPSQLHTRSRNISLNQVTGSVDVVNSNGSVELTSMLPLGNISVDNKNGSVAFTLPAGTGASVNAEVRGGAIQNDLGLGVVNSGDRAELHGNVGDGATQIMLRTSHADIDIHRQLGGAPIPPVPPAKPEGKPKAAAPVKRPHVSPPDKPLVNSSF